MRHIHHGVTMMMMMIMILASESDATLAKTVCAELGIPFRHVRLLNISHPRYNSFSAFRSSSIDSIGRMFLKYFCRSFEVELPRILT